MSIQGRRVRRGSQLFSEIEAGTVPGFPMPTSARRSRIIGGVGDANPWGGDGPWVRRAAGGDAAAWSALVDRYAAYVSTVLRSARVPEADESDAFQFVFIELFKALPHLRGVDHLAPWLRRTALRHAIRVRRRAERHPLPLEDAELAGVEAEFADDLARADEAQRVRDAVASLKDRCRELIGRLFFADPPQPYAEVAAALGLSASSIAMTRQRCLEALERALRARGIG